MWEGRECVVRWSVDNNSYRATIVESQDSLQFKLAPEILDASPGTGKYTNKVDIWALGVILFKLLFEKKPFSEQKKTNSSLNQHIRTADYVFPPKSEQISREALDLFQKVNIKSGLSSFSLLPSLVNLNLLLSPPTKPGRGLPRRPRTYQDQ